MLICMHILVNFSDLGQLIHMQVFSAARAIVLYRRSLLHQRGGVGHRVRVPLRSICKLPLYFSLSFSNKPFSQGRLAACLLISNSFSFYSINSNFQLQNFVSVITIQYSSVSPSRCQIRGFCHQSLKQIHSSQ